MLGNGPWKSKKNPAAYNHYNILRIHQICFRIAILILSLYVLSTTFQLDSYNNTYSTDCYSILVFRFRTITLVLIVLGFIVSFFTTKKLVGRTQISYLLFITGIITCFHYIDGGKLTLDYLYTSFAIAIVTFNPYFYGPISLGHADDSLYLQCVMAIFITSTSILFSSLTLLTDRLDFYWTPPIPLYAVTFGSMFLSSLTNLLPFRNSAYRCN